MQDLLGLDGEMNLSAKGIWSREKKVDFAKLY